MPRSAPEASASWAARDLFDRGGPSGLRVLSLHDRVINLRADEWGQLLFLADPELYRGPASAGLDAPGFRALRDRLQPGDIGRIEGERIVFFGGSGAALSLSRAVRLSFSVPPEIELAAIEQAATSFAEAREGLAAIAESHACSCLLGGAGGDEEFREAILLNFPRLVQALARGDQALFEVSCASLVGLGCGSTPTGDDLIHGALVGLHFMRRALALDAPIPRMPPGIGTRTTALGAHMLEMGFRGLTPEPMLAFAEDLLAGRPIGPSLAEVCRMGADSGRSSAVAFYLMAVECMAGGYLSARPCILPRYA